MWLWFMYKLFNEKSDVRSLRCGDLMKKLQFVWVFEFQRRVWQESKTSFFQMCYLVYNNMIQTLSSSIIFSKTTSSTFKTCGKQLCCFISHVSMDITLLRKMFTRCVGVVCVIGNVSVESVMRRTSRMIVRWMFLWIDCTHCFFSFNTFSFQTFFSQSCQLLFIFFFFLLFFFFFFLFLLFLFLFLVLILALFLGLWIGRRGWGRWRGGWRLAFFTFIFTFTSVLFHIDSIC